MSDTHQFWFNLNLRNSFPFEVQLFCWDKKCCYICSNFSKLAQSAAQLKAYIKVLLMVKVKTLLECPCCINEKIREDQMSALLLFCTKKNPWPAMQYSSVVSCETLNPHQTSKIRLFVSLLTDKLGKNNSKKFSKST